MPKRISQPSTVGHQTTNTKTKVSQPIPVGCVFPFLYCCWVGSLDFHFLDSPHISFQPASSTFCWGTYSTLQVQPLRPPRRQHGPHHAARLRLARVVRLGRRVGRRPGVVFAEPAADAGGGGVSALGVQGEALRLVWVKMKPTHGSCWETCFLFLLAVV